MTQSVGCNFQAKNFFLSLIAAFNIQIEIFVSRFSFLSEKQDSFIEQSRFLSLIAAFNIETETFVKNERFINKSRH